MKVLLSIKPEYAEKILSGEKLYEFRKSIPRSVEAKSCIIYATMPVGKVVGEFQIDKFISDSPDELWNETASFSGITEEFFRSYFNGRDLAHAIKVKSVKRYKKAKSLRSVLPSGVAPQSFCYVN